MVTRISKDGHTFFLSFELAPPFFHLPLAFIGKTHLNDFSIDFKKITNLGFKKSTEEKLHI